MNTGWRPGDPSLLPSPSDLDRYVHHLPDAAERLLAAAEREQAHPTRRELIGEVFDYIETFYNRRRRHFTLACSPRPNTKPEPLSLTTTD